MDYVDIAKIAISALSPIAQKGIEKFTEKAAEETFKERKAIWEKVKGLLKTNDLTLLNLLKQETETEETIGGSLESTLKTQLELNPDAAKNLQALLTRLQDSPLTQITNLQIARSAVSNRLKREPTKPGKSSIENVGITESIIDNEMDVS